MNFRTLMIGSSVLLALSQAQAQNDGRRSTYSSDTLVCRFCDMRYEDLSLRNFKRVDVTGAFLHGANFSWSVLKNSSMSSSNLIQVRMEWSDLDGADLSKATLENATMFR